MLCWVWLVLCVSGRLCVLGLGVGLCMWMCSCWFFMFSLMMIVFFVGSCEMLCSIVFFIRGCSIRCGIGRFYGSGFLCCYCICRCLLRCSDLIERQCLVSLYFLCRVVLFLFVLSVVWNRLDRFSIVCLVIVGLWCSRLVMRFMLLKRKCGWICVCNVLVCVCVLVIICVFQWLLIQKQCRVSVIISVVIVVLFRVKCQKLMLLVKLFLFSVL